MFNKIKHSNNLEKYGYTIIKNTICNNNIDNYLSRLQKDNRCHSCVMWDIRLKMWKYFKNIWNTGDLVCSFDGNVLGDNEAIDWHIDQNQSHLPGMVSVQGVLALKPSRVTHLLEKSHKYFLSVSERCTDNDKDTWESYAIPTSDKIWKKNLKIVTPKLNAGDLLLFDSRLVHSVSKCKNRAVVYVSMVPKKFIDDNIKSKRKKGFLNGIQTTHWCERFIVRDDTSGPIRKKIPKKYTRLI